MKTRQSSIGEAPPLPEWASKPPAFPPRDSSGDPKKIADICPILGPDYLKMYHLVDEEPQASAA